MKDKAKYFRIAILAIVAVELIIAGICFFSARVPEGLIIAGVGLMTLTIPEFMSVGMAEKKEKLDDKDIIIKSRGMCHLETSLPAYKGVAGKSTECGLVLTHKAVRVQFKNSPRLMVEKLQITKFDMLNSHKCKISVADVGELRIVCNDGQWFDALNKWLNSCEEPEVVPVEKVEPVAIHGAAAVLGDK